MSLAALLMNFNRGKNYASGRSSARLLLCAAFGAGLTLSLPNQMAAQSRNSNILTCSSDNGQRVTCNANTRGGVRMVRQLSGSPCQEGATWGSDSRGIWVDRGCRAEFEILGGGGQSGFAPGDGQGLQRRAQLRGGNGDQGKCTIEVVVDGAAEVEIRGDSGVIRNLAGQQPQWRRFECTGPLPANAADFRFTGVDGRGKQQLISDPRNGGAAVVRIEDPQGGAEGYTFDLTWSGGAGYSGGPGAGQYAGQPGGQYNDRRGDRRGDGNRRFSTDQAVRVCQDAVRQQAAERFNARDIAFQRTAMDDNPGRNDWVMGTFSVGRGAYGRDEIHRFACSVNFDNGQIRSVEIDPGRSGGNAPGYRDRNASSNTALMQQCERAVQDRIRRDGYESVEIESMNVDDRTGRNDSIVGGARAARRNGFDAFDFSCAVNPDNGSVRSVDVRRR
jgi:Protein of unknown function (DUF3011)